MTESFDCDVMVVGGGPAGSTMATLLARQGRRVVMVDKSRHPRFHIGESLLPANVPLFEKLGVRAEVERIGLPKYGARFISPHHDRPGIVEFSQGWNKSLNGAWQVRRADLDEILFRHAANEGVHTLEGCRVRHVQFDADGATVAAEMEDGERRTWRARYVVDATGRDTLLANQMAMKHKHPRHNSAALYGHFRGAERGSGRNEGDITVFWFDHGWIWYIPLADGSTSVGAVCWPYYLKSREKPLEEFFMDTLAMSPRLMQRLAGAELIDHAVYATGNFAYYSERCWGDKHLLVGDAYAFVDPVFSSGVYLAMESAFAALPLVAAELDGGKDLPVLRRRFEAHMRKGPREFTWFIVRMTNPAMRWLFLNPDNPLRVREAVVAVLSGDIFGRSRIGLSLFAFKVLYYLTSIALAPQAWQAWRRRRDNIRDVGEVKGENVMTTAQ
jgi:flavin-dependent dehydrogenase